MADRTGISWTDATWNPVTGCDRVSPGCDNCYAMAQAARLKEQGSARYQRDGDPRTSGPGFGVTLHPDVLDQPIRWTRPRRIFVNSMSDLFHAQVPQEYIQQVLDVAAQAPQHVFQILTKRSLRLARMAPDLVWPANVWMGVSVESSDQLYRLDHLRQVPAAKRFISAEPLIGPLVVDGGTLDLSGIDWVITGGESGPGHRPCDLDWVRDIRDACQAQGVAFTHKQHGGMFPGGDRELDGIVHEDEPEWGTSG